MVRLYFFLFGIFLLFTATTCERAVDFEPPELDPSLVVISNFTKSQSLKVSVSKTQSIFEPTVGEYFLNAAVDVYVGDNFIEQLDLVNIGDEPPFYTSRGFTPEVNVPYTIKVEVPGFDMVEAMSSIPGNVHNLSVHVNSLTIKPGNNPDTQVYEYIVSIEFNDPSVANFYHLNFYQEIIPFQVAPGDTTFSPSYTKQITFTPINNNNSQIAFFDGGVLFDDVPFNGTRVGYVFPLSISLQAKSEKIGKIFTELRVVSEEYYLYYNSLTRQLNNPDGPFTEPVLIYNNIENGQGIFAGYNVTLDSTNVQ